MTSNASKVQMQIQQMLTQESGYFPHPKFLEETRTDVNEWPYTRYFRGKPQSDIPFFWEREAGYQKILPDKPVPMYEPLLQEPDTKGGCFQSACNTIFPCYYGKKIELPNQSVFTSP